MLQRAEIVRRGQPALRYHHPLMTDMPADDLRFECSCCGDWHDGLPDLAFAAPAYYDMLSEEEKVTRAKKADDLCSIDDEDFFIRAVLLIPIEGTDRQFGWGVWVSLSRDNFQRYVELYDAPDPSGEGPYFGWLSNRLPWYPETLSLKTNVHLQPYPGRPQVELEPTDHPLSIHQRHGIDLATLQQIVEANLHPSA